jgi:4-amino-4-deoxy-L-arabinose transferase-like glycosyltransferase
LFSYLHSALSTQLLEPEEVRYAEIPRQMLAADRWVVPVLHGQDYLDKPSLFYWLVMGSYRLFGVHEWAARLAAGLVGVLTVGVVHGWGRRGGVRGTLVGVPRPAARLRPAVLAQAGGAGAAGG